MDQINPRYEVVKGSLKLMADGGHNGVIAAMGMNEADWELLTGNRSWIAPDRPRVSAMLQDLVFGSMDVAQLPRMNIAAEYQAAVIVAFVGPNNIGKAAHWLSGAMPTNEALAAGVESDNVTPDQLFALCLEAYSDDISTFKSLFESALGKKLMHFERGAPAASVDVPPKKPRGKRK